MTEQIKKEITKSFAYGATAEEVSDFYGIPLEDSKKFAEDYSSEIADKKLQLEKDGWM